MSESTPAPPRAPKKPYTITRHGRPHEDPYAWLKDPDWQAVLKAPAQLAPEIRAHLDAENAYTRSQLADSAALTKELFAELKGRLKDDEASVPQKDGAYLYHHGFRAGQQYPVHYRRLEAGGADEVVLDLPLLARGQAFYRVMQVRHSPDHPLVGYAVDTRGSERYDIRIRDVAGNRELPDVITDANPGFVWGDGGRVLYYLKLDAFQRPKWVMRHRLGTPVTADAMLYEEPDDGFFVSLSLSASRQFVVLASYDHTSAEARVLQADDPNGAFRLIEPRRPGCIYHLYHRGDLFYFVVHEAPAKDGAIMTAPVATPGRQHWRPLVPYTEGRLIQETLIFADWLARIELIDASPRLVVRSLKSHAEHTVAFDEAAYHLTLVPGFEFATESLRFAYSSMATPERTFDYDMGTGGRVLRKEQEIPTGHDPSKYEVRRLTCHARDGAPVPITLLRRKGHGDDGGPLLLYGYGAYGRVVAGSFSPHRFSLVDRGMSYAIAHVRGGKERGYGWYEDAKVLHKKRTFEDFIDCAAFLVESGVTTAGNIVAHGASAGGMLMGAIANMAPQHFRAIVADVPFVDVLNTMWDKDLPLTPPEWPEWGNPITNAEVHAYIASYSPYDNVKAQVYPHLLVLAGLTDPRVTYWEPAKWVARLREVWRGDRLLLLDTNMGAGHAGASGRFDILEKVAMIYAFALKVAKSRP